MSFIVPTYFEAEMGELSLERLPTRFVVTLIQTFPFQYLFRPNSPFFSVEIWAQGHLKELLPELVKPTKKLDRNYSGQYDFLFDDKIRIEVKASRAVDFGSEEPLHVKALTVASKRPFDMNFQQIKPACSDVFVWVGVWRDAIRYWVLSPKEVGSNKYYSDKMHRGNVGEGQLHLKHDNIAEFSKHEARSNELATQIRNAFKRQTAK